jgi:hypothetical protein
MIGEHTTQEQADAEKAMHTTALRLGYCGPRNKQLLILSSGRYRKSCVRFSFRVL